jgi:hypothetical protein
LRWNQIFLPTHTPLESAPLHSWISAKLGEFSPVNEPSRQHGRKLALIAPRESAKTTSITLGYALRCALQGTERYTVIISDEEKNGAKFLAAIKKEIQTTPRILAVYGDQSTREWREDHIRLKNGCLIESAGRGSKIRGRKDSQNRPTLVIVDDCQSNKDARSPTERTVALDWFLKEVIPAGSEKTNFISVGSALHREAVSVHAQSLIGWQGHTFPAIISYPDDLSLWSEWERLATNLADDKREETARAYFHANYEAMSKGSKTYWPSKWPIDKLMARRAEIGDAAFETEYQGVPTTPQGARWPAHYFENLYFDHWPADLVCKVTALDPSEGATEDADYQAHAMVGIDAQGVFWIDAVAVREPPHLMIVRHLRLAQEFSKIKGLGNMPLPVSAVTMEDNATMGLLQAEIERITEEEGIVLPWDCLTQTIPKHLRVIRADPYLARRQIRVRNTKGGRELIQEWREYPVGEKKDVADAVSTAIASIQYLAMGK